MSETHSIKNQEFLKSVSEYFMDFLDTDFKKSRVPKRNTISAVNKNIQIGLNFDKYPKLKEKLFSFLFKGFSQENFSIKKGEYVKNIPQELISLLENKIKNISDDHIKEVYKSYIDEIPEILQKNKKEYDKFLEQALDAAKILTKKHLILPLLNDIDKPLENMGLAGVKSKYQLEIDISEILFTLFENELTESLESYFIKNQSEIQTFSDNKFLNRKKIIQKLLSFFQRVTINDAFADIYKLHNNIRLLDKVEFYLYFYELSTSKGSFPVFYIPISIQKNENEPFSISFDKRLFLNTKAINFAVQEFNIETENDSTLTNAFERIIYLSETESAENKTNYVLETLSNFFSLNKEFSKNNSAKQVLDGISVSLSNKCFLYLFDKADEALINDYEEILNDKGGEIVETFSELVNGFVTENPTAYMEEVRTDWDNMPTKNKLIRQSPIPLNDEQKQILTALNKEKCKFVTIEGPPGTGKSHTITAIICQALIDKKSVLVLSDKAEALDVVEDKISNTLNKVRKDDAFQNPILRLGKTGNKFYKIVQAQSLEKIKEHFFSYKKLKDDFDENKSSKIEFLKNEIEENISYYEDIDMNDIHSYYEDEKKFEEIQWIKNLENIDIDSIEEGFFKIKEFIETLSEYKDYTFPISFIKEENFNSITKVSQIYSHVANIGLKIENLIQTMESLSKYETIIKDLESDISIIELVNKKLSEIKSGGNQSITTYKNISTQFLDDKNSVQKIIQKINDLQDENRGIKGHFITICDSLLESSNTLLSEKKLLAETPLQEGRFLEELEILRKSVIEIQEKTIPYFDNFESNIANKNQECNTAKTEIETFLDTTNTLCHNIQEITNDDICGVFNALSIELPISEYKQQNDFLNQFNTLRSDGFPYFNLLRGNELFLENFKFENISVSQAIKNIEQYVQELEDLKNPVIGLLFKKGKVEDLNRKLKKTFPYISIQGLEKNEKLIKETLDFFEFIYAKIKGYQNESELFLSVILSFGKIDEENIVYKAKEESLSLLIEQLAQYKKEISIIPVSNQYFSSQEFSENQISIIQHLSIQPKLLKEVLIESSIDGYKQVFKNKAEADTLISQVESLKDQYELLGFIENFGKEYPEIKESINLEIENKELANISCDLTNYDHEFIKNYCNYLRKEKSLVDQFKNTPTDSYGEQITDIEDLVTADMTYFLDKRIIEYTEKFAGEVQNLKTIISRKQKFPKGLFQNLKNAFPCILSGIRDYAEFIPLEKDLFDIIIIDEASQVSIAQALPALIRGKQIIVLGDEKQFSNVKSGNASKTVNQQYKNNVKTIFEKNVLDGEDDYGWLPKVTDNFDIKKSILKFGEFIRNYGTMLKKHFRCYPEIISYSDKYFYDNALQCMKIRGKKVEEVIKFEVLEHDGKQEEFKNTNIGEINYIIEKLKEFKKEGVEQSIGIITPHTAQAELFIQKIDELPEKSWLYGKCRLKIMTFDASQGEERDYIFYSMVATREADGLKYIFPVKFNEKKDNTKAQRLNVGFSRAKECMHFVLSKEIEEYSGEIRNALMHYKEELENSSKKQIGNTDPNSPMEAKIQQYFYSTEFYKNNEKSIELIPQFDIGKYLRQLDGSNYNHPAYKVDFLLQFENKKIIIEYDGFKEHFNNLDEVNSLNYSSYMKEDDIYRQKVLEGYGYKFLRINKFNIGKNPIEKLNNRLENLLKKKPKNV